MSQDITSFSSFNFSDALNKALADMKYHTPSAIQAQTIPLLLEGHDAIALAQTGTGKTAAFALPILQGLLDQVKGIQALVIAPTRELAIQVAEQFEQLSVYQRGTTVAVLCGGQDYSRQMKQLRGGAQIVVGTPGRIMDHIQRRTLNMDNLRTFIIDEADEMLRMGFIEDVETILSNLPKEKQIALFSATMPDRIRTIAKTYLHNPKTVEIRMATATVKSIEQRFLVVSGYQKPDALVRVLATEDYQGVIVFVRTKSSTEEVAQMMQQQGLKAMAIHGDLTQSLRERIIAQFKQGVIDILVATDVAARGLDVERVTHVINYDLPQDSETYVHRIGRTGRAGRSGVTILFVTPKEGRLVSSIERHTRQRIEKVQVPSDSMIQAIKQQQFMNNITQRLQHENLAVYKKMITDYIQQQGIAAEDVAATLALQLNNDMPWQQERPPAPKYERFSEPKKQRSTITDKKKMPHKNIDQELFRIDVGRVHGVKPGNIVGAIANEAGLQSRYISGLKIHDDYSTVLLPKGMTKEVMRDLNKAWVCGRQLKITAIGSA